MDITVNIERRLREFAPNAEIHFERIAVTPKQIKKWKLPTRPTKKTDTRSKGFEGDSVDVDAIAPNKLRALCNDCIVQHIDSGLYQRTLNIEERERDSITEVLERFQDNDDDDDDDDDECEVSA